MANVVAFGPRRRAQLIEQPVLHADETGDRPYGAALAVPAPDTVWLTSAALGESAYLAELASYPARGYGLRRVNAFQSRDGMRYAAVWQWGHAMPALVRHDMTAAQFAQAVAQRARQGYALAHIDACATTDGARFAAIWDRGPAQTVFTGLTAAEYKRQAAQMALVGLRPRQIAGYSEGGARFAVVFAPAAAEQIAAHAVPAAVFHARSQALRARGYVLRDASGYVVAGRPFYAAVWEQA